MRSARFLKGLRALKLFGTLAGSSHRVKDMLAKLTTCLVAVAPVVLVLFVLTSSTAYAQSLVPNGDPPKKRLHTLAILLCLLHKRTAHIDIYILRNF